MTPAQQQAFYNAAGFQASNITFDVRLLVGGLTIICVLLILVGLVHSLSSNSSLDYATFIGSLFALGFIVMMMLIYIA